MAEKTVSNNLSMEVSMTAAQGGSSCFDDDGHLKRTGTVWTASAHIITAGIGIEVLGLAWATAQLGWIAGPTLLFSFSIVSYYTSCLLVACYRSGDSVTGKRNYTYMEAVQANLGSFQVKIYGAFLYMNFFGLAVFYTVTASTSMTAVKRSNCFHDSVAEDPCKISSTLYIIAFGAVEILFSQIPIPDSDQFSWHSIIASIIAVILSFTYSSIALALGISKVAETGKFRRSLTGISIGTVTKAQKIWTSFQALGTIAFAYSYSLDLIETQNTLKSPPSESKTMKRATLLSVVVTTIFYMLYGCFGYAALGDLVPDNPLTGFGYYNPFWLLDIANIAIVVHLVGAYRVYCQPLFAFVEKHAVRKYPNSDFIKKEFDIPLPGGFQPYKLNLFRLVWRTLFVILTTIISILIPFFIDIIGILGSIGFWPLTVYFPVEMYIVQKNIPKWSIRWIFLQILSVACLIISICAAAGSVAGVVTDLKDYRPLQTTY